MPIIVVDDCAVYFRLRRSLRAKRLQIVLRQHDFEVVAPYSLSNHTILRFVVEKRKWMARALRPSRRTISPKPISFCTESEVYFRGQWVVLVVQFGALTHVDWDNGTIVCTLPIVTRPNVENALKHWLKQQALTFIQHTIDRICPILGRWPSRVVLKQPRTRWGSCGIHDVISLHWHLVFAPEGILEYVVAHELCHLVHRHHGKRFWQKVEKVYPDHKRARAWLRKEGQHLMQIRTIG